MALSFRSQLSVTTCELAAVGDGGLLRHPPRLPGSTRPGAVALFLWALPHFCTEAAQSTTSAARLRIFLVHEIVRLPVAKLHLPAIVAAEETAGDLASHLRSAAFLTAQELFNLSP